MGKKTGFMDYARRDLSDRPVSQRLGDYGELHQPLSETERRRQAGRCMDCGVPFCQAGVEFDGRLLGCPLHNLVPEWNDALWEGNVPHALARLLKTSSFPEFTGRVCPALCERACTCGMIGDSVTVRDNELYIIEWAFENGLMVPRPPEKRSGRRVAVVGSGPAGLSAAYWLNLRGHSVTVLERDGKLGGLLRYGIPAMKLPKEVIDRRTSLMEREGVRFLTGAEVGKNPTLDELEREYDAVILCCGAQKPRTLDYAGSAENIVYAADYLKAAEKQRSGESGENPLSAAGRRVAVVGAGDSADDCLAVALRQGCTGLTQLIRRPREQVKESDSYAQREARERFGAIRRYGSRVKAVRAGEDGALSALVLDTPQGEETLEAELLIVASGFTGTEDANARLLENAPEKLLCAGDMAHGAGLVVLAIADGKRAAARADTLLMGYTNIL